MTGNESQNSRYKCVLVIDDDEMDRYVTRRILIQEGFADEVLLAKSTDEAMDMLKSRAGMTNEPDFIFLDLNMPEKNGLDFLSEYSSWQDTGASCPVAMLMNVVNSPDEDTTKVRQHALVKWLIEKPLTREKLREILS